MDLTHAQALIPGGGARVAPATPQRDRAALEALAVWALRFSPVVAPDPSDGLLIDITGCGHLFRSESRLVQRLAERLHRLGFAARVASAPTVGGAWALARFGPVDVVVVSPDRLRAALAELSMPALRLDPDAVEAMAAIGIERIAHVLDLPRASLPARFGPDVLRRLDQALGAMPEGIDPVRPIDPPSAERIFDGPTTQLEAVQVTARELLEELVQQLHRRECGARRIDVVLDRADAPPIRLALTLARPNRNARHLGRLLAPRLERVNLGFGVERVTITAARTGQLRHEQSTCWPGGVVADHHEPDAAIGELTDVLANRLGAGRVLRADLTESHLPERVVRLVPAAGDERPRQPVPALKDADRPSVLFDPPEPVQVVSLTPDGWPVRVTWRGADSKVIASLGPERVGQEWWRIGGGGGGGGGRDTRVYFKAQTQAGRWLWLFREARGGRWFIHGEWA